ncbi:MAG: hypothetical protein D6726_02695 [Nitrospirae bacterium]|nr:MAG: hypothetical protein D6726_02695 [Nitrospirota bacterium]
MKKLAILLIAVFILLTNCKGKNKTNVYHTKEGKITVSESKEGDVKEMTLENKEGTATIKTAKGEIPKDLGVPIYPGASAEEGGTLSMSGTKGGKAGGFSSTFLKTEDDIDKVIEFYKKELPDAEFYEMTTPNGKMASFALGKDTPVKTTVMLSQNTDEKGTNIHISKVKEAE